MKNGELRKLVVDFLAEEHSKLQVNSSRPYPAKLVAEAVKGYAGALGKIVDQVLTDLNALGIKCTYDKSTSPKVFVLQK